MLRRETGREGNLHKSERSEGMWRQWKQGGVRIPEQGGEGPATFR